MRLRHGAVISGETKPLDLFRKVRLVPTQTAAKNAPDFRVFADECIDLSYARYGVAPIKTKGAQSRMAAPLAIMPDVAESDAHAGPGCARGR
jgi:hypothetical protein